MATPSQSLSIQHGPSPSTASVSNRLIIAVYAAAVLLRIVIAIGFGSHEPQITDARDYDRLAVGLVQTGQYITESGQLSSLRPPLYPALVALVYQSFGLHNYLAVTWLQSLISLFTMGITHRFASHLAGPRVGLIAAVIVGFYPTLLAYNTLLLTETLFTCFFTLAVWMSLKMLARGEARDAFGLGLALSLGALTRSILWVCAVPVTLYLVIAGQASFASRIRSAAIALVTFAVVLAPWAIRNTRLQQTFTLVDVMGGRNVMMGNYEFTPLERSWATITDVRGEQAWHRVLAKTRPEGLKGLTQGQIDKEAMRYGVRYFFTHPAQTVPRVLVRFFNFWQLEREIVAGIKAGHWGPAGKPVVGASIVIFSGAYAVIALAAIFGFFAAQLDWRQQGLLLLWIALPCAFHTIAFAHSRYHLPIVPIPALYAAITLDCLLARDWQTLRRVAIPGAILSALLMAGWLREIVMVDLALL